MVSIIIYTTEKTLNHKKGLKEGEEDITQFYWHLKRCPSKIEDEDRIYFATKGLIRGSFFISDIDDSDECDIEFSCESWEDLDKPIPTKSFQGFKYADKVEGL